MRSRKNAHSHSIRFDSHFIIFLSFFFLKNASCDRLPLLGCFSQLLLIRSVAFSSIRRGRTLHKWLPKQTISIYLLPYIENCIAEIIVWRYASKQLVHFWLVFRFLRCALTWKRVSNKSCEHFHYHHRKVVFMITRFFSSQFKKWD